MSHKIAGAKFNPVVISMDSQKRREIRGRRPTFEWATRPAPIPPEPDHVEIYEDEDDPFAEEIRPRTFTRRSLLVNYYRNWAMSHRIRGLRFLTLDKIAEWLNSCASRRAVGGECITLQRYAEILESVDSIRTDQGREGLRIDPASVEASSRIDRVWREMEDYGRTFTVSIEEIVPPREIDEEF